jgi:hypothetical protein
VSAETTFAALLAASATLTGLVGQRIAQNAVPQGEAFPLVVFGASHDRTLGLDDTLLADEVTFVVQCWAKDAVAASAVADAVAAAVGARAELTTRSDAYNAELDAHAVELTFLWFDV